MQIGNKFYHSQDYSRVGATTANYFISFKECETIHFGIIKYFLQISDIVFVAINELKVGSNLYKNCYRTSNDLQSIKKTGLFDKFICECLEINKLIFINSNQILGKCIAKKEYNSLYFISEMHTITEHD